ncbi:LLM class flavin-dependent oxidoreductase [Bosea sp. (in: a-proteobacteria)]|uniref:LLM class flavin-dependent oxidoreductase n=1 Tax=Bosea sp. (in: a-proteobacteria) TaxID=1871050 RepID=UPI002625EC65|nr:LLM class flavin-dependent oxidoreductase [Bosea sp. (in: a-proteobacteria)]MCO5090748.1 LLM class flavin-dependent oxidoreductase [Bosea sp. (in: a-proteobacteria)]
MAQELEFGLDTFGDVTNGADGKSLPHAQVIRNLVAEAELADSLGIDFIGVGEHHRADFAVSAPEVVLAAMAARTQRIRLGSSVTVLSSDDPIRVFQRFATVDALSNGRAEVILGRGSFTESFPLFGFDLRDYEKLFEEKLDLFAALLPQDKVSWQGSIRPALKDQRVYPPLERAPLKTWIGVGGSPESVVRAVRHDLPLMLAVIGGDPLRFKPFVDLYRRAYAQTAKAPKPVGVHSPGYVAASDDRAKEEFFAPYKQMRDRIGAERGWPPMGRDEFEHEVAHGSLYLGSPETVARKIAATVKGLGVSRFQLKYSAGPLAHERMLECIRLYGETVIPLVREMLGAVDP